MRRIALTLLILIGTIWTTDAQHITATGGQDIRLLFAGDDKGNDAGTFNGFIRIGLQGYKKPTGTSEVIMEYEYADLAGGVYQRWSLGYLHSFDIFSTGFYVRPSAQFGFIQREGATMTGIFSLDIDYEIAKGVFLGTTTQGAIRSDLNGNPLRLSNFLKLTVNLIKT